MILFLDIDGVLNSLTWLDVRRSEIGVQRRKHFMDSYPYHLAIALHNLDPKCILRLLFLVTKLQAKIVITSSLRDNKTPQYFMSLFTELGGPFPDNTVLGITPVMDHIENNKRFTEITTWINQNEYVGPYLIIDDDDFFPQEANVYLTDPQYGLTDFDVDNIIKRITVN